MQLNVSSQVKFLRLLSPLVLQNMNVDNFNDIDDYGAPLCEQQYTHGPCYISLFKFKSFDQSDPRIDSNSTHLFSCGTII